MDIASFRGQDTKAWPGKISIVVVAGNGAHSVKEIEQELQRGFTTTAVVFEGKVEEQGDLPIVAKRMKLKNKLVRLNTNGTNPEQLESMIRRRVVDYVSLRLPAPLYKDAFEKQGARKFEQVRESVKLLESSNVQHEIVLEMGNLSEQEIKDAASQIRNDFVLYGDRGFDELRVIAQQLSGPKHIRIRNRGGEQSIK